MSNFSKLTKHPKTGEMQMADWLDDHFGRHRYGVRFPDGNVFPERDIEGYVAPAPAADAFMAIFGFSRTKDQP